MPCRFIPLPNLTTATILLFLHITNPSYHHTPASAAICKIKMSNQYDQASTDYKQAFSLYDKRGNGRVALNDLGDLLRACGQNPTLAEIQDLEKNVGTECELPTALFPLRPLSIH